MKLKIAERINLLSLMPTETNFVTLKVIRDLEEELSFSEKEIKDYEIETQVAGQRTFTKWNDAGNDYEKNCKIGEKATDLIVEQLEKLDKENKLTNNHFTLYEKFVK